MVDIGKNSILIVDDEQINLDILSRILSNNFAIKTTKNGLEALDYAHRYLPDVILLDIVMPGMDGFEVLTKLKESPITRHIPVIIITALDGKEHEERGFALEAADFIPKPFNIKIVRLRLNNQVQIVNQIKEIKRNAQELIELHSAVAATNEKSKFFAKMSHEMRTPLNAVIGLSEMMLEDGSISEDALINVEKISNAGTSLLHTVNDILDISKIEAGKFKIIPGEYETAVLINDTIIQSLVHRGDKHIDFILNIDENIFSKFFGDSFRIKQILINLLSNAFKYTKEGSVELKMHCEKQQDDVFLVASVKDTGIGIPAENLENMFTDYSQVYINSNIKIEGTGLGLSITKMLVEMMNGTINVQSECGKGSVFTIKLLQKFVTDEILGIEIVEKLKNFNYLSKRKKINRNILPYAQVLVVDDVLLNLDVAKGMMRPYRMKIDCVTSGQQAVDIIREEKVKYNAIFMDHMMPGMDGIEAVRIIREEIGTDYAKNIPIIALTANAVAGNEEMFLNKGFQAFVPKPIEILCLDEVLQKWVRNEELEKKSNISYDLRSGHERRSGIKDRRMGYDRRLLEKGIEGLNINKGIARFSGDSETFLEVLRSFSINTCSLLEVMKNVNKENLADYAINVHGVKSSCKGICADEAGEQAFALELAAKAGDLDFVLANNAAFIENVLKLADNINAFLLEISNDEATEKLKKDKPYNDALVSLAAACEQYKIGEIEKIMKEIEVFEYTNDDGLIEWLRKNVEQMNFMEIAEKLGAM